MKYSLVSRDWIADCVEMMAEAYVVVILIIGAKSRILYVFMLFCLCIYHKGAIAPLYIGIVVVGQHRSHTFAKSAFPWQ